MSSLKKLIKEQLDLTIVQHNLDIAEKGFLYFITNMDYELSQWIQYVGFENKGGRIWFNFKSSQNQLSFSVYGGLFPGSDPEGHLNLLYRPLYHHFRDLKYDNISK